MKLTIQAPSTPAGDYKIYESGQSFPMRNMRANIVGLYEFNEDAIFHLNKYVTKWKPTKQPL